MEYFVCSFFFPFLITKSYQVSLTQVTLVKPCYIFIIFFSFISMSSVLSSKLFSVSSKICAECIQPFFSEFT